MFKEDNILPVLAAFFLTFVYAHYSKFLLNDIIQAIRPCPANSRESAGSSVFKVFTDLPPTKADYFNPIAQDQNDKIYAANDHQVFFLTHDRKWQELSVFQYEHHRRHKINSASIFKDIKGLTTDNRGNLYVAELEGIIHIISPQGDMKTFFSDHKTYFGASITADNNGNVYFVDGSYDYAIRKIDSHGHISTLIERYREVNGENIDITPSLRSPGNLIFDNTKQVLYLVEGGWLSIIQQLDMKGHLSTLSNIGQKIFWNGTDNYPLFFMNTASLATDKKGNLYIGDTRYGITIVMPDGTTKSYPQSLMYNYAGGGSCLLFPEGAGLRSVGSTSIIATFGSYSKDAVYRAEVPDLKTLPAFVPQL